MRTRLIAATLLTLAGCLGGEDDPYGDAEPVAIARSYRIDSTIDVPASAAAPGPAATALDLARGLEAEPAATLFELAERAGVPAVGTLRDALPGALEDRLDDAIDAHVDGLLRANPDVAAALAEAVAVADTVLGQVALTSELIPAAGRFEHRLLTIGFTVDGRTATFDVADAPLTTASGSLWALPTSADSSTLELGAHGFGLPIGTYALQVIDAELERRAGGDLRAVLGDAVDCAGMAADVADECVLGACIGHEDDLRAVCEAGLDRLVDELGGRITDVDREVLHFDVARARAIDGDGDGRAEYLSGTWLSYVDLGVGLRPAPGRFATTGP